MRAAILIALAAVGLSMVSASHVRGVRPELASKYEPQAGQLFQCLDGTKNIPWEAVNDNFCDCSDGSDEPGAYKTAFDCPYATIRC